MISFDVHIDYDELASKIAAQLGVGSTAWGSKVEAIEYTRVSVWTVERWMTQGLPYVQAERRLLYDRRTIDERIMSSHTG